MNDTMKKVMVFGTFDVLHEGHLALFREAKKYGNFLIVVVARDSSVKKIKGFFPQQNELERFANVKKQTIVNIAVLGYEDDFYRIIEEQKPNILCFGYDQNKFNVEEELKKRRIKVEIHTLSPHQPEKYKSSLMRNKK